MVAKTCITCKFEPEWQIIKVISGTSETLKAGKCKFPIPTTLAPMVGKTCACLNLKDDNGKYFVDMSAEAKCYAWEAKE